MPRRSTRSSSRGRAEPAKTPTTPKTPKSRKKTVATEPVEMQFEEGAPVMARWPGSSLFFKAKVNYVRAEDKEYDVEYENGTVYTIKAKDVFKQQSVVMKKATRQRSKSRAKSPSRRGRKASAVNSPSTPTTELQDQTDSTKDEDKTADEKTAEVAVPEKEKAEKVEKPIEEVVAKVVTKVVEKVKSVRKAETPTRISARIAAKASSDAFSDDESEKVKLAPNPELPDSRGRKKGWSFEWAWALLFMLLAPAILVTLHTLCQTGCKLEVPKFPKDVKSYVDLQSLGMLLGFCVLVDILSFLPIGATVNGRRMNGFASLLLLLSAVPAIIYFKVSLSLVTSKYFTLMTSSVILSGVSAIITLIASKWGKASNMNSKGNTGNLLVDLFNGRELNPKHLGMDWKLQCLRLSMMLLALLNVVLVTDSIISTNGKVSPALILASAFQVVYALDAMFFEEYFFQSHDAMNTGMGWSLISSYCFFPFLPTLTTRYLINNPATLPWYTLTAIGLMNALGYVIFRSSETQRCEFAKNPNNPCLSHLETLSTAGNRKIIVSGWWGLVRHPNYLGEILMSWSWILPAVGTLGLKSLVPYYLPIITTLMLVVRTHQINQRNKRKYGAAWTSYTDKVRSNIIPKVY